MAAIFKSFDQIGDNQVRDDLVEINVMNMGSAGYWLKAVKKNDAGVVIDESIVFVPELFDKSLKFIDIAEDDGVILAGIKTELGRVGIIRSPQKGTVGIYYSAIIKNAGSFCLRGNTIKTEIFNANTFVDLILDGSIEMSNNFLWELSNPANGELQYNGVEPDKLNFKGLVAAYSAGGIQRFNFRLLKNGLPLESPDGINIPLEIRTTIGSSPLLWYVSVLPGDKFRLQVENADGVSDIVIDTLMVTIS